MRELYVENEGSSSLTVLDIHTGKPVRTISIPFPYNLYFTPDGTKAIDVVEREMKIQFRDPHTWKLIREVPIPWPGADHLDFSADGSYLLISTEYSGIVAKVDVVHMKLAGYVNVGGLPIDVKVSPDGSVFYVTNQGSDGVSIIDPNAMKVIGFLHTGRGAHAHPGRCAGPWADLLPERGPAQHRPQWRLPLKAPTPPLPSGRNRSAAPSAIPRACA